MSRRSSLSLLLILAVGLSAATLASAQGTTSDKSTTTATTAAPVKAKMAKHHAMMPKVDLNSATKDELMKLPAIGDALADKIIAARPFKMKSELTSKGILTKKEYVKVAAHVVAKQAAGTKN